MEKKGVDKKRRNLIKILALGGGALLFGKILGPTLSKFLDEPSVENNFINFRTVENKKGLTIYDKTGEEIFTMDNGK